MEVDNRNGSYKEKRIAAVLPKNWYIPHMQNSLNGAVKLKYSIYRIESRNGMVGSNCG